MKDSEIIEQGLIKETLTHREKNKKLLKHVIIGLGAIFLLIVVLHII